jgi:large repetitive protein
MKTNLRSVLWGALTVVALAAAGCSTDDSPSTPTQPPAGPTPPGPGPTTFTVSVNTNPASVDAATTAPSTVTVTVSSSSGSVPANSQVVVTTSLGNFGSAGGATTVTLDLVNGQAQTFLFGNGTPGVAQVRATFTAPDGTQFSGSGSVEFRTAATFFISSVSPAVGSAQGGDTVTVLGGGFDPPIRVLFGASPATVLSSTSTQIRVRTPQTTVPAGSSLPVAVTVTINLNETGQRVDTLPNAFTYTNGGGTDQPVLLSMTPAAGPNDGGTNVTLVGDGFEAPVQVLFGSGTSTSFAGVEATVRSVTRTRIELTTPQAFGFGIDNRDQLVAVMVRNVNSGNSGVLNNAFQYGARIAITSMGPGAGPRTGGTRVTIFGQGFDDPVAVSLGGVGQTVVSTAGSEIVFLTSGTNAACAATDPVATPISVTNIDTGANATAPIGFTYLYNRPLITGINPSTGPSSGGNVVTVSGSGFEAPARVLIGGSAGSVGTTTSSSISVTVPPFTGTFPSQACTVGSAAGTQLVPVSVDVQVINLTTGCGNDRTFTRGYTYNPPSTACVVTAEAPVSSFTFTLGGTNGRVAAFTNTSTGNPTTFLWNFGDPGSGGANTSALQGPSHDYNGAGPGSYLVSLTVTNAAGSSTSQQFVNVP